MYKQKSFTLIELLVVIVIIGILAGVIMISTSSSIDKANFAKAQAFSSTVQNELLLNLVSEWTFDNASNIGEDTWGNNHGNLYNFANPATSISGLASANECVFGTCLKFDGVDDYVEILSQPSLHPTREYSITFWMKPGTLKEWSGLMGTYPFANGYLIYQCGSEGSPTGVAFVDGARKDVNSNVKPMIGKWYYIVFAVEEGKSTKMYINGEFKKATIISSTGIVTVNENPVRIAGQGSGTPVWFDGFIDDVRLYNAALSSSQVKQNYIAGLNSMLANGNISKQEYNERINNLAYNDNNE